MIKQIFIWSKWLRVIHGIFVFALITLFLSGWLLSQSDIPPSLNTITTHQVASTFIGVFLFIRIILLFFGKGAEHIRSFFDQGDKWIKTNELLAFYFSLGKRPLPNWHSKPALWSILYLVMFLIMALLLATGILQNEQDRFLGFILLDSHLDLGRWLAYLISFHILASFLHDSKSLNANISGMLNGHRSIHLEDKAPNSIEVKFDP